MTDTKNLQSTFRSFVEYLESIPLDKSMYKTEVEETINHLRSVVDDFGKPWKSSKIKDISAEDLLTWRLGLIRADLNKLLFYAKHPQTIAEITHMSNYIDQVLKEQ